MSTSTDAHGAHDHDHGGEPWDVHAHISSVKFLVGIFAALIILTILTVATSRVDLGAANGVVAVVIATIKVSLVATFFMHLRHDRLFNAVIFVAAFVFLGIFMLFSFDDLSTRGEIDRANGVHRYERNGEVAPGGFVPVVIPMHGAAEHGAAASEHH